MRTMLECIEAAMIERMDNAHLLIRLGLENLADYNDRLLGQADARHMFLRST